MPGLDANQKLQALLTEIQSIIDNTEPRDTHNGDIYSLSKRQFERLKKLKEQYDEASDPMGP